MTDAEIKWRIELLEKAIKEATRPGVFILNQEVVSCREEILELRKKCSHSIIEDEICQICGEDWSKN